MSDLPRVGAAVTVHDPLGYSGHGTVLAVQDRPHPAVQVRMATITDRTDQTAVGRAIWVLGPHITEGTTCTATRRNQGALRRCGKPADGHRDHEWWGTGPSVLAGLSWYA